jgi:hypothetical protein
LEIVKERDGLKRLGKPASATSMVTKDTPVLASGDRVLDPCSPSSMSSPGTVAYDSIAVKPRGDELGHAAVATIREDAPVVLASRLDDSAAVVDRVVAMAGTGC